MNDRNDFAGDHTFLIELPEGCVRFYPHEMGIINDYIKARTDLSDADRLRMSQLKRQFADCTTHRVV